MLRCLSYPAFCLQRDCDEHEEEMTVVWITANGIYLLNSYMKRAMSEFMPVMSTTMTFIFEDRMASVRDHARLDLELIGNQDRQNSRSSNSPPNLW